MNCPRCNSSDYYEGVFGGNCVNYNCSLFKGSKVSGTFFNYSPAPNTLVDWDSIVKGSNSHNRWDFEFQIEQVQLWIWRRGNNSCFEFRTKKYNKYTSEYRNEDFIKLVNDLGIDYDIEKVYPEDTVKKWAEIIIKYFKIDPTNYYPRPF